MSEEWKNLTNEQKVPYQKMADEDKVRYQNEKAAYEKTKGATPAKSTNQSSKKTPKKVESESESESEQEGEEEESGAEDDE